MTYKLCPISGLIPTPLQAWLDYGIQVLLRIVQKRDKTDFDARWPSVDEMKMSVALLQINCRLGPLLAGRFAIMVVGRMPCATYT